MENTNKPFIIGIYPSDIFVSSFPASVSFCIYFELHDVEIGEYDIYVRAYIGKLSKNNKPVRVAIKLRLVKEAPMPIILPKMTIPIQGEDDYSVDISFDQTKWSNVIKRKIALNPAFVSSTVSQPPS